MAVCAPLSCSYQVRILCVFGFVFHFCFFLVLLRECTLSEGAGIMYGSAQKMLGIGPGRKQPSIPWLQSGFSDVKSSEFKLKDTELLCFCQ